MLELAGDAERRRQVEMADPQAVDAVEGGDGVGVLDPGPGLDLGEEGGARVGGGELVQHRAAPVEVVRHAQRHAALARRARTSCSPGCAAPPSASLTIGSMMPSAPMSAARAMWWYSLDGTRTIAGSRAASK